ncbi:NAD(P)-dependent oxidoreductase [Acidovorax sp. JHL-9]|uniref:NAD(P)-dependent oxidoreductase n=1 Tax=Acidovorax sp. JHL-9 TaxID=1276756 RepID=UPI0003F564CE|nr:NAD(P)-dependent oxidoreductase [Acidovorax sp. JHL-9]
MNIGMIGIGLMGHGIATNLQKHGHQLTLLRHSGNQPVDGLVAAGAGQADTPAEVARRSQMVLLCVTGTPQVEAVLHGPDGVLSGLATGSVVIDCSTAIPSSTEKVAQAVAERGGRFLDSPMTRTPKEAAEGRLNLLVGGDTGLFQECLPVLRCFAENVTLVGGTGAGHRMKLLHNYVSLGSIALIAEAAAAALNADIDPAVFVEVLAKGGGAGSALERLRPYLTQHDPSALRFAMSNALKDIGYFTTMAKDSGSTHGIANAVQQTFAEAVERSGPDRFVPELVDVLRPRPH